MELSNYKIFIYLQLLVSLIYISLSVHGVRNTETPVDDIVLFILIIASIVFGYSKYIKNIKDGLDKHKIPVAVISLGIAVITWISYIKDDCVNTYGFIILGTVYTSLILYSLFF
jgi:hypothetical protein